MGKKKKKKKKRGAKKALSLDVLEKRARASLEAGKYRQARDYFKELCKHDSKAYLPELIKAHEGLALKMINDGHVRDAKTVLDHVNSLKGMAKKSRVGIFLSIKEGDFSGAALAALQYLEGRKRDRVKDEELIIYDALILSFDSLDSAASVPSSIREEAIAIQSALSLLCEEKYDEVFAALRRIGLRSPFSHWKLFVKGLCAFYRMEDEKARKAFVRLPPGSVPARAAEPYIVLLDGPEGLKKHHKKETPLRLACRMAGRKDLEPVLPRAEYLWRVGRFRDSYAHVRNNLTDFPSEKGGIIQDLTDFYFNAPFHMQQRAAENYVSFLKKISLKRGGADELERLMVQRVECLYEEKDTVYDIDLFEMWENFLRLYCTVHGRNHQVEALVYLHLGDIFSMEVIDDDVYFSFFRRRRSKSITVRNRSLAERCYQKSLELNPAGRDAHFSLLSLYEKTGQKAKVNRKLDEIIKLFPEDKEALYKAGLRCMERKALIKGMKYLERAIRLDPLDSRLRESFIICCIKAALGYAEKSKMDKCRSLLPRALERAETDSDDFNHGQAYLYVRWANFELLNGNSKEGEELLNRAYQLVGNGPRLLYFNWLIARFYGVPSKYLKKTRKLIKKEFSGRPSPEKAVIFAETISYFLDIAAPDWLDDEMRRVNNYASKAAREDFSRDQAIAIAEFALSDEIGDDDLAWEYIGRVLEENPEDPLFLFFRFKRNLGPLIDLATQSDLDELLEILELAEKQGDRDLVAKIDQTIKEVENVLSLHDTAKRVFVDDEELEEEDLDRAFDDLVGELLDEELAGARSKKGRQNKKKRPKYEQLNFFES